MKPYILTETVGGAKMGNQVQSNSIFLNNMRDNLHCNKIVHTYYVQWGQSVYVTLTLKINSKSGSKVIKRNDKMRYSNYICE